MLSSIANAQTIDYVVPVYDASIPPIMVEIARCESGGTHFKPNGEVIRGVVNPDDIGKYQINLYWHGETAKSMGLDLFKVEDNEEYALYLYKTQGVKPWNASRPCWQGEKSIDTHLR